MMKMFYRRMVGPEQEEEDAMGWYFYLVQIFLLFRSDRQFQWWRAKIKLEEHIYLAASHGHTHLCRQVRANEGRSGEFSGWIWAAAAAAVIEPHPSICTFEPNNWPFPRSWFDGFWSRGASNHSSHRQSKFIDEKKKTNGGLQWPRSN